MGADSSFPDNVDEKVVSVLTVNAIRYQGLVHLIEKEKNTVTLKDVTVFGTEDRVVENRIPMQPNKFEYVMLTGEHIKEVVLYEYLLVNPRQQHQYQQSQSPSPQDHYREIDELRAMKITDKQMPPTAANGSSGSSSYLDIVRGKQNEMQAREQPAMHHKHHNDHHGGKGNKGGKGVMHGKGKGVRYPR
eukprot:TRINITY_DN1247_c0_g1_i1.p1 TRINITY_DN1247_c0_g1~~TRINITY_DN1247_c0_g1_i1.p1  ORF type:complete len:189 (+),score=19.31 TRINITY_DN1247_c0_g1_i1:33-599(+)